MKCIIAGIKFGAAAFSAVTTFVVLSRAFSGAVQSLVDAIEKGIQQHEEDEQDVERTS